ncbi:MAG TPA: alpha/beta hydrolase [Ilumatobacteraceae bacterium]|nr:alpha/beta hydrolase [Ilumatobacteraceae bacterium]
MTMRRVESSDGVSVAVHDLGGRGRTLLISHATGFHAHAYVPMAAALAERFHTFGLDFRGHGDTPAPPGWEVDWRRYGDDASVAAHALAPDGGLIAFGHSMGGSALLMAAHRDPSLFELIIAFEPIGSPRLAQVTDDGSPSVLLTSMVEAARRRRRSFRSYQDAIDNYGSKPPMAAFTPDALHNYVEHGFAPTADGVTLRCDPELEAQTFMNGRENGVWDLLPEITTPVLVVIGEADEFGPASTGDEMARRLANGTFRHLPHLDHMAPFTHPDEVADLVADAADTADRVARD